MQASGATIMTDLLLELLSNNDPDQTWTEIDLDSTTERDDDDDAAIAQALEQNPYISYVQLCPAQRDANWDHLYRVLATRGSLVHFCLTSYRSIPVVRMRPILQAIQQNASVRFVEFHDYLLSSEDLCSFLDAAVHVTDLTLNSCELTGGEHGARDVASALQRNTNIVTLKLCWIDAFLVFILEGLVLNSRVRQLAVSSRLDEVRSNALQGLLESTGSIQRLELSETTFTERSFRPVAQGLIDSSVVEDITFQACSFISERSIQMGERSIHPLNDFLGRKQNLRTLAFKNCEQFPQFLLALFSGLRRPASPLRHFQFDDPGISSLSNLSFRHLCQAVAESKLESFAIRVDHNQSRIQSLADTIPSMKIRELVIQFDYYGYHNRDHRTQQALRQALKNNFTLQSVKCRLFSSSVGCLGRGPNNEIVPATQHSLGPVGGEPRKCPEPFVEGSDDFGSQSWTRDALSLAAENWPRSVAGW